MLATSSNVWQDRVIHWYGNRWTKWGNTTENVACAFIQWALFAEFFVVHPRMAQPRHLLCAILWLGSPGVGSSKISGIRPDNVLLNRVGSSHIQIFMKKLTFIRIHTYTQKLHEDADKKHGDMKQLWHGQQNFSKLQGVCAIIKKYISVIRQLECARKRQYGAVTVDYGPFAQWYLYCKK